MPIALPHKEKERKKKVFLRPVVLRKYLSSGQPKRNGTRFICREWPEAGSSGVDGCRTAEDGSSGPEEMVQGEEK